MERYFNPKTKKWDGPDADYRPESDDIPWSMVPEKKITVEDVKYALSSISREPLTIRTQGAVTGSRRANTALSASTAMISLL